MLTDIRRQIDKSLNDFLIHARREYRLDLIDPLLFNSLREYVLRPGKRIRPTLLILSYKGYTQSNRRISPSIYYVSTCIELLHNFMLIHDDIIDRADLRRGRPTMHRMLRKFAKTSEPDKLGSDLGIIAGDIVYAAAFDAFLSIKEDPLRKERALKHFIQTAIYTAMGEFIDTVHGVQDLNSVKEDDVLLNYSLKTARYTFECPMVVGAILAGAGDKDVKRLEELGLLVGQAFQMQDDVIGIFDSQKNIGKSILSDLAECKKTLLVCHANHTLKGPPRTKFLQHFNRPHKTYADLVAIRKIFLQSGSLEYTMNQIGRRVKRSRALLNKLTMKPRYRTVLAEVIDRLFSHSALIAKQNQIPTP